MFESRDSDSDVFESESGDFGGIESLDLDSGISGTGSGDFVV